MDKYKVYDLTIEEIKELDIGEVYDLMHATVDDIKEAYIARCTFWLCRLEIYRREKGDYPESIQGQCLATIIDTENNVIFESGNFYTIYTMEQDAALVINDKGCVFEFSLDSDRNDYIWHIFSLGVSAGDISGISEYTS